MEKRKIEKGKLGKIRDAVKEATDSITEVDPNNTPPKSYIREGVFDHFRWLHKRDPEETGDHIEALAAERRMRLNMGPETWNLFESVAKEKWAKVRRKGKEEFQRRKEDVESAAEEDILKRDIHSRALHESDVAIAQDPRIRAAFAGNEELVHEALRSNRKVMRSFYESMFDDEGDKNDVFSKERGS